MKPFAGTAEVQALQACVRTVHRLVPPRPAVEVLALAREILGEAPGETSALTLDVTERGRVLLFGTALSAEDARRVELVRARLPEVRVVVE